MSDLMLDIINWILLITIIVLFIFLLFIIVYGIYYIISDKSRVKKYKIRYIVNEISGECYVVAKNKKQAIKELRKYYIYISDVKEIE